MHFYTLGGHFEYFKVTGVTNLTHLLMYLVSPFQHKSSSQKHPLIKHGLRSHKTHIFSEKKKSVSLGKEGVKEASLKKLSQILYVLYPQLNLNNGFSSLHNVNL